MNFTPMCGTEHCKGGWDCHPNLMNSEVEALFGRLHHQGQDIKECCYWSVNNAFESTLTTRGGDRPEERTPCEHGTHCYRKNPEHLLNCSHPGDRDPMFKP